MVDDKDGRCNDGKSSTKVEGNYGDLVVDRVLVGERLKMMRWIETMGNHNRKNGSRLMVDVKIVSLTI